jgi:hypothetical protein
MPKIRLGIFVPELTTALARPPRLHRLKLSVAQRGLLAHRDGSQSGFDYIKAFL